jgi:hypothetical protein
MRALIVENGAKFEIANVFDEPAPMALDLRNTHRRGQDAGL